MKREKTQAKSGEAAAAMEELSFDELDSVAGGAQVETVNTVKNNKHDVNIGPTVVINM